MVLIAFRSSDNHVALFQDELQAEYTTINDRRSKYNQRSPANSRDKAEREREGEQERERETNAATSLSTLPLQDRVEQGRAGQAQTTKATSLCLSISLCLPPPSLSVFAVVYPLAKKGPEAVI